jgi:hypothetical protein
MRQVGWHGCKGRRGGGLGLFVKDPMDGNQVIAPAAAPAASAALAITACTRAISDRFPTFHQTTLATLQLRVEDHRHNRIVLFNTATKDW